MNITKQIRLNLRIIKLKRFLGSLSYSFERDWWERRFTQAQNRQTAVTPGKLNQVESTPRGIKINFDRAELEITFLTSDLVRLDWQPGKLPVPYGIVRQDWSEVETTIDKKDAVVTIASSDLKLIVSKDGSLELQDAEGQTLRRELPPTRTGEAWQHQGQLQPEERIYGLGERAAPFNLRANRGKKYRMWHFDAGVSRTDY